MSLAIVVMAAGKGTRLNSRRAKVLHSIGGKPLLAHVIAAAAEVASPKDIFAVVGHQAEQVKSAMAPTGVNFVLQAEQLGTRDAVQCAKDAIAGYVDVLVLPGDVPLIRAETIEIFLEKHREQDAAMTILATISRNPYGQGRTFRQASGKNVTNNATAERNMLHSEKALVEPIGSGIYAFKVEPLLTHLDELNLGKSAIESHLIDLRSVFEGAKEKVVAVEAADPEEISEADTIAELVALDATLRMRVAFRLMSQGVTIFKPETCLIDTDVEVGPDTVIEPGVQLLGSTRIGSDCLIRTGSVIENSVIENRVLIRQSCVIADSVIRTGAMIGPFTHLRPGNDVGEDAHVGNFVEMKKARLGKGVKAGHLTYLGDAEVGEGTNIGAGVITCNFDGVKKHKTIIGSGAFVGSDSTLVAPVVIGDGSYVGAGSCITREVPKNSLAVARSRQITKEGWASYRRSLSQKKE